MLIVKLYSFKSKVPRNFTRQIHWRIPIMHH